MRKVAAIDIGTNTMRLLLCEYDGTSIINKEKHLKATRMGENVSKTKKLSSEVIERNIEALKYFKKLAEDYDADSITAIATSAVRDALNKDEFLLQAKAETQIDIKVISGKEEAELGIIGVMSDHNTMDNTLVIDIGGGSTEFILCEESNQYTDSVDAGAVRMTEYCIKNNPLKVQDKLDLIAVVEDRLREQIDFLKLKKIHKAIAIGGTATTIAAMYHDMCIYKSDIVHNTIIDNEYLQNCFNRLSAMSIEERFKINGLQKERADVIVAGTYILKYIIETLGINQVTVSDKDNLEGMVIKYTKVF